MCWLDRFRRDETGSATIEFVLWIPIIVGLLVIVIDVATLYITHSEMWNVARDTARRMVTGNLLTEQEAEQYAIDAMSLRDFPYAVQASYPADPNDPGSVVEVIIAFNMKDISILGYGSPLTLLGADIMARVSMRPDPLVPFGAAPAPGPGPGPS
ncbi:MAG TPA: TadE/TadG family type IV pilus assembly protein [Thermohalobaculum sp.]|nr:TadE/TadG family type IV pilus assembly protein [Thermohalobaculum sp.]